MNLSLLCAGAARGLVLALKDNLATETGAGIDGTFGAVGAMKERLLAGAPCDVIVLTAALIDALARDGHVLPATIAPLGRVGTGIAVRAGEPLPRIANGDALRATLLASTGIVFPDPVRATAGIHFAKVLERLGIDGTVAERITNYPNGETSMRALAEGPPGRVGCTQITEIMYTPGVTLVGPLPAGYTLETVYTVAVCARAAQPDVARAFAAMLAGPAARALRDAGGFEPVAASA